MAIHCLHFGLIIHRCQELFSICRCEDGFPIGSFCLQAPRPCQISREQHSVMLAYLSYCLKCLRKSPTANVFSLLSALAWDGGIRHVTKFCYPQHKLHTFLVSLGCWKTNKLVHSQCSYLSIHPGKSAFFQSIPTDNLGSDLRASLQQSDMPGVWAKGVPISSASALRKEANVIVREAYTRLVRCDFS
eukprot:2065730-Amphidinium_carterae.1